MATSSKCYLPPVVVMVSVVVLVLDTTEGPGVVPSGGHSVDRMVGGVVGTTMVLTPTGGRRVTGCSSEPQMAFRAS